MISCAQTDRSFVNTYILETGEKRKSENGWPKVRSADYRVKESKGQMFHYYSILPSFHDKLGVVYTVIFTLNLTVMD